MITQRPCVNGILAAVLSASFVPVHGALAKDAKGAKPPAAKHALKKSTKPATENTDSAAPSSGAPGAAAPAEGDAAPAK